MLKRLCEIREGVVPLVATRRGWAIAFMLCSVVSWTLLFFFAFFFCWCLAVPQATFFLSFSLLLLELPLFWFGLVVVGVHTSVVAAETLNKCRENVTKVP